MADLEKVIKGFECCHVMVHDLGPDKTSCGICPYKDVQTEEQIDLGGIECVAVLHDDALELLKEYKELLKSYVEMRDDISNLTAENEQLMKEHAQLVDKYVPLVTDRQEIVRCKDCKHASLDMCCTHPTEWSNEESRNHCNPEWFCADGERRDDDA